MADRMRPYLFYDVVVSICSTCYRKVEGKILLEEGRVLLTKRCPEHGFERVLVADAVGYDKVFRILIMQFIDAPAFDVRSVKKTIIEAREKAELTRNLKNAGT